jgi:hypothetical protein
VRPLLDVFSIPLSSHTCLSVKWISFFKKGFCLWFLVLFFKTSLYIDFILIPFFHQNVLLSSHPPQTEIIDYKSKVIAELNEALLNSQDDEDFPDGKVPKGEGGSKQ